MDTPDVIPLPPPPPNHVDVFLEEEHECLDKEMANFNQNMVWNNTIKQFQMEIVHGVEMAHRHVKILGTKLREDASKPSHKGDSQT